MSAAESLRMELVSKLYAIELRLKHETLAEGLHFYKSEAKSELRQYTKLSVDLHLKKSLLDAWTQI